MILAKLFSDNIAKVTQMGCKENIFICFEADLKVEDHLGLYNSDDGIDDIGSGGDWMGEDHHSGCGEEEDYWNPARWGQTWELCFVLKNFKYIVFYTFSSSIFYKQIEAIHSQSMQWMN